MNPVVHALITHHTMNTQMTNNQTILVGPPLENHTFSLDDLTMNEGAELVTEPEEGKEMIVRAHLLTPSLFCPSTFNALAFCCASSFISS